MSKFLLNLLIGTSLLSSTVHAIDSDPEEDEPCESPSVTRKSFPKETKFPLGSNDNASDSSRRLATENASHNTDFDSIMKILPIPTKGRCCANK